MWTIAIIIMVFIVVWGAVQQYSTEQDSEVASNNVSTSNKSHYSTIASSTTDISTSSSTNGVEEQAKETWPIITLLSPTGGEVLKEGTNIIVRWNIDHAPLDKANWEIIGSVRCDNAYCGRTGLEIFSYSLSDNPDKSSWKVVSPFGVERFRGPNKDNFRNWELDAKSISSDMVVCLVKDGFGEIYAMGWADDTEVRCSSFLPITIMFNPPLSF